ncbi:MAG: hypothetical protein ACT4OP_07440 [Actinomycetota bacterium]
MTLAAGQEHPGALIDIISLASQSVVLAHTSTWGMFGLDTDAGLLDKALGRLAELGDQGE